MRKIFIYVIGIVVICSLFGIFDNHATKDIASAYSSSESIYEDDKWLTSEEIGSKYAQMLMNSGVVVDEIIPIEDSKGYSGLCISYSKGLFPSGYVIYNSESMRAIAFGTEGESPYNKLITQFKSKYFILSSQKNDLQIPHKIFTDDFINYSIAIKDNNINYKVSNTNIEVVTDSEYNKYAQAARYNYGGYVRDWQNTGGNLTLISGISTAQMNSFVPRTMSEMNPTSNANCAPTAGTNMLKLWRELKGKSNIQNDSTTYNYIVNDVGEEGIMMSSIANSSKRYANSRSYTVNLYNYVANNFNYFTRDINNGYTILVSIGTVSDCHLVVAVGYLTFSNSNSRYLRILNGWDNNTYQYVDFDYYNRCVGYRWRIA